MVKKKKLSNKKKELICNILIGIGGILMIFTIFNPLITEDIFHIEFDKGGETIYAISWGIFVAYGIIMMIILNVLGFDFEPTPSETFSWTTKYKLKNYKDEESFFKDIDNRLKKINYNLVNNSKLNDTEFVKVYMKPKEDKILDIVLLIKVNEYNKKIEKEIEAKVGEFSVDLYGKGTRVKDYVKALRIICVDKITSAFQKESSVGIDERGYSESLTIGVSFESKKMFIREFGSSIIKRKKPNNQKKSIWVRKSYVRQEKFKEVIFNIIDAEKIEEEKK